MGPDISPGGRLPDRSALAPPQALRGQPFGLDAEQVGTTLYLRLTGQFEFACIGGVEAALERISEEDTTRVVFDLQRVGSIDLAGLRTILRADDQLELVDQIAQDRGDEPFRRCSA